MVKIQKKKIKNEKEFNYLNGNLNNNHWKEAERKRDQKILY